MENYSKEMPIVDKNGNVKYERKWFQRCDTSEAIEYDASQRKKGLVMVGEMFAPGKYKCDYVPMSEASNEILAEIRGVRIYKWRS